ncbi:MAG: S9 family peptidase [Phycisphaerales bacterium]|nr:S9 family peptidase [Phycisphaerales bacterium]
MRHALSLLAIPVVASTLLAQVYPAAPRQAVIDDYHGVKVADPYRWLEDENSAETQAWIAAENQITSAELDSIPVRDRLVERLTDLFNYERFGIPAEEGGRYFYSRNDGLQNQSVLYVAESLDATARVLIDPNKFTADGTQSLADYAVSPDGRFIAYGVSDGGSDWNTWFVMDVGTGEKLADTIADIKYTGVAWDRDSSGFYYSRYPAGAEGKPDDQASLMVYHHALGSTQADDTVVHKAEDPTHNAYGAPSEDGRFLVITHEKGYLANAVYAKRLGDPAAELVTLFDAWDAQYRFLGNVGETLFFATTKDAPNQRVVAVGAANPDRIREVIPQSAEPIQGASMIGRHLVVQYLADAKSLVKVFDLTGQMVREVDLPGIGSAGGFGGHADRAETFYAFNGFTQPGAVYRYDVATGESTLFRQPEVKFDLDAFETEQVFYESKDGTRVPMFLVYKKGMERNGDNPTLLYGYGGFNVPITPRFSVARLVWVEMGGIYAVANLRGGGEYGEDWHLAGTKERKQNVFDDFIGAAEWLIDEGYTSTPRLAIEGGSNGGLLVGACMTQRPDLFGACVPHVGVMDMLRYHLQSANARQWSDDFGISEDAEGFRYLWEYSPYHNLRDGLSYPPTLVTTAEGDDRVSPWHSYKFAAMLQHAHVGPNPVLIRIESRAGHGAGKPLSKTILETADVYAFLAKHLGMETE